MNDLALVAGMAAAKKIMLAWPNLWVQEQEQGDVHEVAKWDVREPWSGKTLEMLLEGNWVSVPVATDAFLQAVSALAQANLESRNLMVRILEGQVVEVWLAKS